MTSPPTTDGAALFGQREAMVRPALSPDGTRILYLAAAAGRGTALLVAAADGGSAPVSIMTTDGAPTQLEDCDWTDNQRIVCTFYSQAPADGMVMGFTRAFAIDADGRNMKALSDQKSMAAQLRISVADGGVIDWMQGQTGKVLMIRDHVPEETIGTHLAKTADGYGVDVVDTRTLASTQLEAADPIATDYISDGRGVVRMKGDVQVSGGGTMRNTESWYYRTPGSRQWRSFSQTSLVGTDDGLRPLSVDPDADLAYCLGKKDGRDALFTVALDGTMKQALLYANPRVDVDDVVRLGRQARLIGVSALEDSRLAIYFDPQFAALAASLSKALPGLPLIHFVSSDADEKKLLLFAGSDIDPGRYYVFDRASHHLNEIALARPVLEHATLAAMKPTSYPAADGTMVPAYLTLPPGSTGKGLPAIVLPHGGPASRDEWGFDWLVQFFAARGYAVLQPEFRGSTGYGDAWLMKNGFQNWRAAIGDVVDAGRWLVSQGIAAPTHLAVFGWSYGGYAALQSNVLAPDLFKAALAVAPVTDFGQLSQEASRYTNSSLVANYVGGGPNADAGSPARHADAFKAPVLLFHGTADKNVDVAESRLMDDRLRRAGKRSTLVVYPDLTHSLPDSTVRADLLRKSDAFLRASLGL